MIYWKLGGSTSLYLFYTAIEFVDSSLKAKELSDKTQSKGLHVHFDLTSTAFVQHVSINVLKHSKKLFYIFIIFGVGFFKTN